MSESPYQYILSKTEYAQWRDSRSRNVIRDNACGCAKRRMLKIAEIVSPDTSTILDTVRV